MGILPAEPPKRTEPVRVAESAEALEAAEQEELAQALAELEAGEGTLRVSRAPGRGG
jgi:hypothetical protein